MGVRGAIAGDGSSCRLFRSLSGLCHLCAPCALRLACLCRVGSCPAAGPPSPALVSGSKPVAIAAPALVAINPVWGRGDADGMPALSRCLVPCFPLIRIESNPKMREMGASGISFRFFCCCCCFHFHAKIMQKQGEKWRPWRCR